MEYIEATPHGSLAEESRHLVAVARGDQPADAVIRNGRLVNVHTREILPDTDLVIARGRIARIALPDSPGPEVPVGPGTREIDAEEQYLVPGFLDSHVHIESSMCTATGFTRGVIPRGTTGVFMDPHEIANVLGLDGVRYMLEESRALPLKIWCTIPSCVPAAPGFEDAGAVIKAEELARTMDWPDVIGLGEMMNFPGVIRGDGEVHDKLTATYESGKVATGHYASPDIGAPLNAYVASGVSSCHESVKREHVLAKLRLGMWTMLRQGSAWKDVPETIKAVTENNIDTRHLLLVSDDCHPETILDHGHLDRVLRRAISEGLNPLRAIQAVTLNAAEYFGVHADVGSLSPGKCADVVFLNDLAEVGVERTMVNGEMVYRNGEWNQDHDLIEPLPPENEKHTEFVHSFYPSEARDTVHVADRPDPDDFVIPVPESMEGVSSVTVELIEIQEAQVGTRRSSAFLPVVDDRVQLDPDRDVCKVFCFDRHHRKRSRGYGFVGGFGFDRGAVASTVAHDSHNLVVVGRDDESMATAAKRIVDMKGGMAAADGEQVLGDVALPVAGLMSDQPIERVAEDVRSLLEAWRELGCDLESPFMTMALLALPVIPEIRVSNRGLIDAVQFEFIDPIREAA